MTERERATRNVLAILRSPLALMSKPQRAQAVELAKQFNITAEDLIEAAVSKARSA